jgi:hypothetical protein
MLKFSFDGGEAWKLQSSEAASPKTTVQKKNGQNEQTETCRSEYPRPK